MSGARVERGSGLGLRLLHSRLLDHLALAVEPVELGGERARPPVIAGEQQLGAECRIADAAAGVDARTDEKAEVPAFRRAAQSAARRAARASPDGGGRA